jgi:hypothetical protein
VADLASRSSVAHSSHFKVANAVVRIGSVRQVATLRRDG